MAEIQSQHSTKLTEIWTSTHTNYNVTLNTEQPRPRISPSALPLHPCCSIPPRSSTSGTTEELSAQDTGLSPSEDRRGVALSVAVAEPRRPGQPLGQSALKRQKKAIRFQKIRRQMEAPGAPPRTLTWEAMEQIRYLHKEFAASWSVPRLAEGFDVSIDVIRRVLKSKFVPTSKQKLKQDQKVLKNVGLSRSFQQLPGSGDAWKPLSAGPSMSGSSLMPGEETSSKGHSQTTALKVIELNTYSTDTPRRQKGRNKGIQGLKEEKNFVPVATDLGHPRELQKSSTSDREGTRGTHRDGLPNGKELKEWEAEESGDQNFSNKVVQRGQEFFDSNGNFLYRI
ncbi:neugrin isoform X2 [Phacochoerus africanus]|uniref:neugrin isoform X2 n=1 Tax=Phacochoerus africanus TaxID=41426 RepID=UPI001FD8A938|nr:neugrin isoform X2 [Phacochoerus africanus]XP_047651064.1 neugrin isoform X2 [Phacochoerus africanus]